MTDERNKTDFICEQNLIGPEEGPSSQLMDPKKIVQQFKSISVNVIIFLLLLEKMD